MPNTDNWEKELLTTYSRKNEWRPDASPTDVVAFIARLLEQEKAKIRVREERDVYIFNMGVAHERARIEEAVGKLRIKDPKCYCREYTFGEHDCGETSNAALDAVLKVIRGEIKN